MSDTKTKSVPKLSVKPPGHWRNLWAPTAVAKEPNAPGVERLPDGTALGRYRHLTREMAEQKVGFAIGEIEGGGWMYLGPVHFPEDAA